MFKKILIANRGEIALRIEKSCTLLGIKTVIIYTESDKDSLAARSAKESYQVDNYLNMEQIICIARACGADAIHPGYGFLSEDQEFNRFCKQNGLAFIGPSLEVMERLGNKVITKRILEENHIPIIKEYQWPYDKIYFPVMIKAKKGGGGKGIYHVQNQTEFEKVLTLKRENFQQHFYVEQFIPNPRHIEVQIIGDKYGNVLHLGERDCSIQRRNQKIVEESPAPNLSDSLRTKILETALQVGRIFHYDNIGTVEFLLSEDHLYFLEINPRIQVEHGVTEAVTGLDLVKEQIKIAIGEKIQLLQDGVLSKGHAIECRICAESPLSNFTPSPGQIQDYNPPPDKGIRIDSDCYPGYKVKHNYDSLLSKLIVWGENREEAILKMEKALGDYVITGVEHTIPLLLIVMQHPQFRKGEIDTSFLWSRNILQLLSQEQEELRIGAILCAAIIQHFKEQRRTEKQLKQDPWMKAVLGANISLW